MQKKWAIWLKEFSWYICFFILLYNEITSIIVHGLVHVLIIYYNSNEINVIGRVIDAIARQPLWKKGLQYLHGTGHGIGSYLSVHEGKWSSFRCCFFFFFKWVNESHAKNLLLSMSFFYNVLDLHTLEQRTKSLKKDLVFFIMLCGFL